MKNIFLFTLFFFPTSAFAATIPDFPAMFYGSATINSTSAPTGTIIRAYVENQLVGQVTLNEEGIYGYNNPLKQQLLVPSGTGTMRFTVQSSLVNNGAETEGSNSQTHNALSSGAVVEKNFDFIFNPPAPSPVPPPPPPPPPPPASSGGGGGGVIYFADLKINNGALMASSTAVTLNIVTSGVSQMWIANDAAFSSGGWIPVANTHSWTLSSGAGIKTVYARFGSSGSVLTTAQDAIELVVPAIAPISTSTTANQVTITAVPTPATSSGQVLGASTYIFTRTLSLGSRGNDVTELQKRLTLEGVYTGPVTGYFGPLTFAAVKKYQGLNNLETVGIVGPKTRALLNQKGIVLGSQTLAPSLPEGERQALIQTLTAQIAELLKLVADLQAKLQAM